METTINRNGNDNASCPKCGNYNAMMPTDYDVYLDNDTFPAKCRDCGYKCLVDYSISTKLRELSETDAKYLKAFQGKYALGEFESLIVKALRISDLSNRKALATAFPDIAKGHQLWLSGEYN